MSEKLDKSRKRMLQLNSGLILFHLSLLIISIYLGWLVNTIVAIFWLVYGIRDRCIGIRYYDIISCESSLYLLNHGVSTITIRKMNKYEKKKYINDIKERKKRYMLAKEFFE